MNPVQPTVAIIRIPDIDGSKTFLQIPIDGKAVMFSACESFQVLDGDDYNLMEFNDLVLAVLSEGGESSIELARIQIAELDGQPAVLHTDPVELGHVLTDILTEWDAMVHLSEEQIEAVEKEKAQ